MYPCIQPAPLDTCVRSKSTFPNSEKLCPSALEICVLAGPFGDFAAPRLNRSPRRVRNPKCATSAPEYELLGCPESEICLLLCPDRASELHSWQFAAHRCALVKISGPGYRRSTFSSYATMHQRPEICWTVMETRHRPAACFWPA